ncbi:hypothetical protein Tco_0370602 [Tanacetum coccineum]
MELENSQNNALAKLPMLKLGEYEMWEIRINRISNSGLYSIGGMSMYVNLQVLKILTILIKSKKELEQERLSFAEAIRLQEQMDEEQRAQISRDEEITRQWNKEEEQRVMSEAKSTKKID